MILKVKKLSVKKDNRGWLAEIIQSKDTQESGLGLVLITTAIPGQTKGNHYHKRKSEWYCFIKGKGMLRVWNKDEKKELEVGENNLVLVEMPKNYFHSITNIGEQDLYVLVIVSEPFDEEDPDTYYE